MADHPALHHAASALLQQNQPAQAVEVLLKGLREAPADLGLRTLLGSLYARLGQRSAAIECHRVVAASHAAAGNPLGAIAACGAVLQLDPTHTQTQQLLADLYTRTGEAQAPVKVQRPRPGADAAPPPPAAAVAADWFDDEEALPVVAGVALPELPADLDEASIDPGELPRVPLFSDLSREAFVWLLPRVEVHHVRAGEVVATEGDYGDSLFVVVAGTVRVEKQRADGPPLVLNHLGPNTFFGEIALLGSGVRTASVVATTDVDLLELSRSTLDELRARYPNVDAVMRRFSRERLLADLLKTSPLLRTLDAAQVRALASRFEDVAVEAGTRLQVEGKVPGGLHIILDGRCEVSRLIAGRKAVVSELGPGDAFGGTSFLTGEPAATTVTARVRTTAVRMPSAVAAEVLSLHQNVATILQLVADGGEQVMGAAVPEGGESSAAGHLQGDLGQLKPPSLLVFFEMERMTGVLRLSHEGQQASLFLKHGRILDVEAPGRVEDPVAKVGEVIGWSQGAFSFSFEPVEREDRVKTGTTGLLLEAARVADEASGG